MLAADPPNPCPDCGRPIPRDSVRGICVACTADLALPGLFGPAVKSGTGDPAREVAGVRVGHWQLLGEAGEGAFGVVFEAARDKPVRRRAALKRLKVTHASREASARFAAECDTLAMLDHPGIARLLDAGDDDGQPWFAMEWIEGARPLTEYCGARSLPRAARLALFCSACDAVAHAHQRGVIHRDLKPSNILTDTDGAVKIIDFGIARATERLPEGGALLTVAGQVLGTPAYMSPEQAAGHGGEADTRSDIYSLGAVLYELLTGRPPFPHELLEGATLRRALEIVAEEPPPAPSSIDRTLRGPLEWILLKALEKDPARRYETAAALARDIRNSLAGGTVLAAPPSAAYRIGVFVRKHRAAASGAAAVFAALLAGLAATTAMYRRAQASSDEARRNASRGEHMSAQTYFDNGQPVSAASYLVRAVRSDPRNRAAAERLLAELAWTDFPQALCEPVAMPQFLREVGFSPDGTRLAALCHEDQLGPGSLRLFSIPEMLPLATIDGACAFAFAPDSATLAVAMGDGQVQFHAAADGAAEATEPLAGAGIATGMTWVRDDRIACIADSTLRLWSLPDRQLLHTIPDVDPFALPGWSPDGVRLACIRRAGDAVVIDAGSGRTLATLPASSGGGSTAFAAGGSLLAVQSLNGALQLYSTTNGKAQLHPMQSGAETYRVHVLADGDLAITTGFDGVSSLWDLASAKPLAQLPPGTARACAASHGGTFVLCGNQYLAEAVLWDTDRLRPARAAVRVTGGLFAADLSADGRWLACGGRQRLLSVHDLAPRAARPTLLPFPATAWQLAWSADGQELIALGTDGRAAAWDAASGADATAGRSWEQLVSAASPNIPTNGLAAGKTVFAETPAGELLPAHHREGAAAPSSSAASPDGRWLAVGFADGRLRLTDLREGTIASDESHANPVLSIAFSSDSRLLAAGLASGDVVLLEPSPGATGAAHNVDSAGITALAFIGRPERLVCGTADGRVIPTAGDAPPAAAAVGQIISSTDGRWFASAAADASAQLWDADSGAPAGPTLRHRSISGPGGLILAFSPDGTVLATGGSFDNTARLWSVPGGIEFATFRHPSRVSSITFGGNDRLCCTSESAIAGGNLHLWDVATATALMPPQPLPCGGRACCLALSPDDRRAAVGSEAGAVAIFDLPPALDRAPAWLAAFAETRLGAGPSVAIPAADRSPAADWARWIASPSGARGISPLARQGMDAYLEALRTIGNLDSLREYSHLEPSLALRLALRARESMWRGEAATAKSLAERSMQLPTDEPLVESLNAFTLQSLGDSRGAQTGLVRGWPELLQRLERLRRK